MDKLKSDIIESMPQGVGGPDAVKIMVDRMRAFGMTDLTISAMCLPRRDLPTSTVHP